MNVLRKDKTQNGFTIIEVVLVLAIAGLIFLMVFIALPALQASQRDSTRKNDVSSVAAAVTSFTGNNRGLFPDSKALTTYVKNKSDNTTSIVVGKAGAGTGVTPADGVVTVYQTAVCGKYNGGTVALGKGTARQFVVVTRLEAGGGSAYCQDS